jgi:hypothetical protein
MVINKQNGHFFIKNEPLAAILNFQFSPNSFPDILSPRYSNPYAKFQKNPSTFATCRARTRKVYGRGGGHGSRTMTKP